MRSAQAAASVARPLTEGVARSGGTEATAEAVDARAAALEGSTVEETKHAQQCLYRLGAGATMFEVKDPDPRAVDKGRVLGVRIEVCIGGLAESPARASHDHPTRPLITETGIFLSPYYLLLNRPVPGSPSLRIHKHTIPPCIALSSLASVYLPKPASASASSVRPGEGPSKPPPKQDLAGLVRSLRRELLSYHLRLAFIDSMRQTLVATPDDAQPAMGDVDEIVDVSAADADGREIKVEWADRAVARIRIGAAGDVQGCVVHGPAGRDRAWERKIRDPGCRVESLIARLTPYREEDWSTDDDSQSSVMDDAPE